jgi:hypothetical protein
MTTFKENSTLRLKESLKASAQNRAQKTNATVASARRTKVEKARKERRVVFMDKYVSPVKSTVCTIIWLLVCLAEWRISMKIYAVYDKTAPFVAAFIVSAVGFWIAELLKNRQSDFHQLLLARRRNLLCDRINTEIEESTNSEINTDSVLGLLFTISMSDILILVSLERVDYMMALTSQKGFGAYDVFNVVCFIVEIYFGMYLLHTIERFSLIFKIRLSEKELAQLLKNCALETQSVVDYYDKIVEQEPDFQPSYEILVCLERFSAKKTTDDDYTDDSLVTLSSDDLA